MTAYPEILQIGAVGVIFFFAIREFFSYLKSRGTNEHPDYDKDIALVRQQLTNHMTHACADIAELKTSVKDIDKRLVEMDKKLDRLT